MMKNMNRSQHSDLLGILLHHTSYLLPYQIWETTHIVAALNPIKP